MLDDHRGKAVAAIGDFSHRASLPLPLASELSGYLTTPLRAITPVVVPPASHWRNLEQRELYLSGLRFAAGEET